VLPLLISSDLHKGELLRFANRVERSIREVFEADSLDVPLILMKIIVGVDKTIPNHLNASTLHLLQASSYHVGGLMKYGLDKRIKILFGVSKIAKSVNTIFVSSLGAAVAMQEENQDSFTDYEEILYTTLYLRSCPAVMFYSEFLSQLGILIIIGEVLVDNYGHHYGSDYIDNPHMEANLRRDEITLIIFWCSHIAYELGQVIHKGKSKFEYLRDEWNMLDMVKVGICYRSLVIVTELANLSFFLPGQDTLILFG
jgi:hypothetical protein